MTTPTNRAYEVWQKKSQADDYLQLKGLGGNVEGGIGPTGIGYGSLAPEFTPTFVNVLDYGVSGSGVQGLGAMLSGSNLLTLSGIGDFQNGQGIQIEQAGPVSSLLPPVGLTVTPTNGTGSTSYEYQIASIDHNGGCSAAGSPVSISNGVVTLGMNGASQSFNFLSWTAVVGAVCYAVYGRTSGSLTLIGVTTETVYDDVGIVYTGTSNLPGTPPISATNGDLITTVVSGEGTSSLGLAAVASRNVVTAQVNHNDTVSINSAIASLDGAGGTIYFPDGVYSVYPPLQLTSGIVFRGESRTASLIRHANGFAPAIIASGTQNKIQDLGLSGSRSVMVSVLYGSVTNFCMEDCNFGGNGGAFAVATGALGIQINRCYFTCKGRILEIFNGIADPNNWLIQSSWFQSGNFENFLFAPIQGSGGQCCLRFADCVFEGGAVSTTCTAFVIGGLSDVVFDTCNLSDWASTTGNINPVFLSGWANTTGVLGLQLSQCDMSTSCGDFINSGNASQTGQICFVGGHYSASGSLISGDAIQVLFLNAECLNNVPPTGVVGQVIVGSYFNGNYISYLGPLTTPASSSAQGYIGQQEADANYLYVCTAANTWKRVALSSF